MFSRKRLAFIVIITLLFSGLFFLFNIDYDFLRSQVTNDADHLIDSVKISTEFSEETQHSYLIVGRPTTQNEQKIQDNVVNALTLLKVDINLVDVLTDDDLVNQSTLIFVVADVSQAGELERIANYIETGGLAIFAAGLPNDSTYRYLDPILGIIERGDFKVFTSLKFNNGYFPYEEISVENGFLTYSASLRVDAVSEVMIESDLGDPLVWTHPYKLGRTAMLNGTFMESKLSIGVLFAALANTKEHFIYPISATKTIFLDAIPPLFDGNDDNSFKYYGRSAESFVRDKLWAVLLQKASILDLRLNSSFMAIDKQEFDAQNANQQTFAYLSQEIVQNQGEITLSGNHVELNNLTYERVDQTKQFFEKFFPNYTLHVYNPLYGKITQEQIDLIQSIYPNMNIIRMLYDSDEQTQSSGDFSVVNGNVIFPTTTYGYKAEGLQLYTFLSVLTSHGLVSHSFDINSLFTVPSNESNWNSLNTYFDQLSDVYFKETPWLETMTISSSAEKIKELDALEYQIIAKDHQILIECKEMTIGQKFLFYSKDKIKSIDGAQFETISANYYLVEAQTTSFSIQY